MRQSSLGIQTTLPDNASCLNRTQYVTCKILRKKKQEQKLREPLTEYLPEEALHKFSE